MAYERFRNLNAIEVKWSQKVRREFRQVARDVCGESMDIAQDDIIVFIYDGKIAVGVANARLADEKETCEGCVHFCHELNFLFVQKKYQMCGLGSKLVCLIEQILWSKMKRPIRCNSAWKAVNFFLKNGYACIGEASDMAFTSTSLFSTLQLMKKYPP